MKTHLLPNKFKKIGIIVFILFCIVCIADRAGLLDFEFLKSWPCISLFNNEFGSDKHEFIKIGHTDPIDEIKMLSLLISLCFIALSREKDEDEMAEFIRMQSFVWSFWFTAILLALGILFTYNLTYLSFALYTMYFEFIVFIVKFNYEMHKVRRENK